MPEKNTTDLVVIGGGPGGYAAAFYAADLGMNVTLIDTEENPGGVCLYRGCIPSKALLHVAKLINEAKEAANWGISFGEPEIDLDRLRAFKNNVVGKLTGGLGQLSKARKITFIRGYASFVNGTTLHIKEHEGGENELTFTHAILATGSRPATIPGIPESDRVMDSSYALDLPDIPGKLLVIGGGYIGLELGTVYAALGSRVTVVEMTDGLLPGADRDMVRHLQKRLEEQVESIMLKTKVTEMKEQKNGIKVTLQSGDEEQNAIFDRVLISVGRKPNTEGFGLENTRVALDDHGFVVVDPQRRTAEENIFAIGDITGDPMLAHKASHEARSAVDVIAGKKSVFEPWAIPAVVFTDPEIAWAGLTETEAKAQGRKVEIARFPWSASGRATTLDRSDGVTKLVVDPETERILGVGIAGPGAGELIAEGVLAIEMASRVTDVAASIHPHPTLSETVMEAADAYFGHSTHMYRPKRK
ncbi:MAG: dihydrolipoyl dehydrogenase [Bacteroidetes bacterium]|nr:dihydrolipoyl dehydrogenase [Bacteroidota bacterium]